MDMGKMFKIKQSWDTFTNNHPRFPQFLTAVKTTGIKEGTVIEISITDPDGKVTATNIKVTQSDLDLIDTLRSMTP